MSRWYNNYSWYGNWFLFVEIDISLRETCLCARMGMRGASDSRKYFWNNIIRYNNWKNWTINMMQWGHSGNYWLCILMSRIIRSLFLNPFNSLDSITQTCWFHKFFAVQSDTELSLIIRLNRMKARDYVHVSEYGSKKLCTVFIRSFRSAINQMLL